MPKPFQLMDIFPNGIMIPLTYMAKNYTLVISAQRFLLVVVAFLSWSGSSLHAQLVINEVSQGASGTKEYVELVVTGTPTCSGIPTVDLRNWYIDDNNGTFASGAGTGIASGCVRFTTDPFWATVPIGTIIVIYNDIDINPAIPAQDLSLTDGNCVLVIPVSNCTLLEKHSSQPAVANPIYPTSGLTTCGLWATVGMANADDSFQTVNPSGVSVHSVSWGNNTNSTIIYFAGSSAGSVAWNANSTNTNPATQANWTRTAVAGNETPGQPNNPANAAWIASMNNNCSPFVPLSATGSGTGTCSCTGTATASPSGGIGPYTYLWAPSGGNNSTATGLCAGSYTCTVTDAAGCTQNVNVTVSGIAGPSVSLQSITNASCNGGASGSATVNATGGSGVYTYSWSPSGGNAATATGLTAGNYTCTITDSNGCTTTQTVAITAPSGITNTASQTNVLCRNGNDGTATVFSSGGTGPYTYNWSPSGGNASTATTLNAGSYTCTVTDANGCTSTQTFLITQPGGLSFSNTSTDVLCNGDANGSATVNVAGGVGGYTYVWSPSGGTAASATGLSAGTYTCIATDANGCTIASAVIINQPVFLAATSTAVPASCSTNDGSVTAFAVGGTPGYTYLWSPSGGTSSTETNLAAGTYTCLITDANGCTRTSSITVTTTGVPPVATVSANGPTTFCQSDTLMLTATGGSNYSWNTGDTTTSINVTTAGTYTVIVSNACGSDTTTITVNTLPSPTAVLSASGPTTFCVGDSVILTASGGNSYLWSTGSTATSITVTTSGTYSVVVTDACGSDTTTQVVSTSPAPTSAITASGPTTFCAGNNVTLTASGGGTYLWSTGATSSSITVGSAGTYTVLVSNSCGSDTSSQTISVLPLPVATISASGPLAFCTGGNVTLTAGGGGPYVWSTGSTANSIVVSNPGSYTVAVSNSCGVDSAQVVVSIIPPPVATLTASGPTTLCAGNTVTLTASGGTNYSWSTGATSSAITVNSAGTYSVVVSNACGSDTVQQIVNILPLPVAAVSGNTIICPGETSTLTASGGNTYVWSTGATTGSIAVAGGTYFVIASNACGSDTAQFVVQPSVVQAVFVPSPDSGLVPLPVSFTDASTNAVAWNWDFGNGNTSTSSNPSELYSSPGTYTVTLIVTNADGCTDTTYMVVIVTDVPGVIEVPNVFTPNGDGINDLFVPYTEGLAEFTMEIYDRWGALMMSSTSASAGWDGKTTSGNDATDATYYYIIRAIAYNSSQFERTGFFTLIR